MPEIDSKVLKEIKRFQNNINYQFAEESILIHALTHRSYYTNADTNKAKRHNERLEFLGDSVLGLIISDYLFQEFPNLREGPLTKIKSFIVSKKQLYEVGKKLKIEKFLFLSADEKTRVKKFITVTADSVEAVIAAIYLDGGIDAAREFILSQFADVLNKIDIDDLIFNDYKSVMQQIVQRESQTLPVYRVLKEKGPEHNKTFVVQLFINNDPVSRGTGPSKKLAEQKAAQKAYKMFKKRSKSMKKMMNYLDKLKISSKK